MTDNWVHVEQTRCLHYTYGVQISLHALKPHSHQAMHVCICVLGAAVTSRHRSLAHVLGTCCCTYITIASQPVQPSHMQLQASAHT